MKWLSENKRDGMFVPENSLLDVTIHKYAGYDNMLFVTCRDLNINAVDLETENLQEAYVAAKELVAHRFAQISKRVEWFMSDNTETEFVKYKDRW